MELNKEIKSQLNQLITALTQFNNALNDDKIHLSRANAASLQVSNEKKQLLIQQLDHYTNNLKSILTSQQSESLLKTILANTNKEAATETRALIKAIHDKIEEGYELLARNNAIVTEQVGFVKRFIAKVLNKSQPTGDTYQKPTAPKK